jgi:hypothetical protein
VRVETDLLFKWRSSALNKVTYSWECGDPRRRECGEKKETRGEGGCEPRARAALYCRRGFDQNHGWWTAERARCDGRQCGCQINPHRRRLHGTEWKKRKMERRRSEK